MSTFKITSLNTPEDVKDANGSVVRKRNSVEVLHNEAPITVYLADNITADQVEGHVKAYLLGKEQEAKELARAVAPLKSKDLNLNKDIILSVDVAEVI